MPPNREKTNVLDLEAKRTRLQRRGKLRSTTSLTVLPVLHRFH